MIDIALSYMIIGFLVVAGAEIRDTIQCRTFDLEAWQMPISVFVGVILWPMLLVMLIDRNFEQWVDRYGR